MRKVNVYQYDAFSTQPNKGNPAGVVLHGDELTPEQMQQIAYKAQFNETAFVMSSDLADLRIRYFTPGQESDLCGHATIASLYALHTKNLLSKQQFTVETKAGILPMEIQTVDHEPVITMRQAAPQFKPFAGSREELAHALGILSEDIDENLPIVYGSTGNWTLIVPLKSLNASTRMKPIQDRFPALLSEMPEASIHPFCLDTVHPEAHMHGRHFSSPFSGTVEDAVTGTASGVIGAYYATYIDQQKSDSLHLIVEQGQELKKDGIVHVFIEKEDESYSVTIAGQAVYADQQVINV
ncbi:PhzF family phenazine biosynthesis isomerase [Priestia megaterium]|nr:PhzF family phenazine biosynthesis isomerase [Priestia megaterium]